MQDRTEEMEGDMEIASSSASSTSWNFSDDTPRNSLRLQSTLSELEQTIKTMQTLIGEEDGTSFTQRAETYYQKRPQLVKNMKELQELFCILSEQCSQTSARSSLSETSQKVQKLPVDNSEYHSHSKTNIDEVVESSWMNNASKLSMIAEESCIQVVELAKRNEEKREAKRELSVLVEKLVGENGTLMEQQSKLMDEIGALSLKVHKLSSANRVASTVCNTSKLDKLKNQVIGKFKGGD